MPAVEDLIDREGLADVLEDALGPADTYDVEYHDRGFSNETLFVTWGESDLVLRRPPPGETADTAHDVLREHTVMDALAGTDVPVPNTVAAIEDAAVIGAPFYVMERLPGDVMRFGELERFSEPEHRRAVGTETVDTLAAIHTVDLEAAGLADFGSPEGFTERQVERWRGQFEWAFERTADVRTVPAIEEVGDWLAANVPEEHEHTLVHGDYKLDNVIFAPGTPPVISGVLDWEMATLGDPLCDLGWLLFFWPEQADLEDAIMQVFAPTFLASPDYHSRAELLERYVDKTGFAVEDTQFYRVLAVYKMAALGEMFFARYVEGHSDSSFYAMMEDGVPMLADQALAVADGERPL